MASSAATPAPEGSGFQYRSPLDGDHHGPARQNKEKGPDTRPARRQPRKSVVSEGRVEYSKKAYKRDTVLLAELLKADDTGTLRLPDLNEPVTAGERGRINMCCMLMAEKDLEAYREEFDLTLMDLAEQGFHDGEFLQFITQWRAGPTGLSQTIEEEVHNRSQFSGNDNRRLSATHSIERQGFHTPDIDDRHRRRVEFQNNFRQQPNLRARAEEEYHRQFPGDTGYPGPSFGGYSRQDARRQPQGFPDYHPASGGRYPPPDYCMSGGVTGDEPMFSVEHRPKANLKASDIMLFDPKDSATSVSLFIKRINTCCSDYGDAQVLFVLPLCLRGDSIVWYTGLPVLVRDRMRWDRTEWVQQLSLQFMLDRSSAREKMDKYTHSLLSGDDVRTYFMKKISLLEDALISDEEEMTEKIWKGLDPILMTLVDLPRGRDCLEVFRMRLYDKEFAAKKLVETNRFRSPASNLFGRYGKTQGFDQGASRFRKPVPTKDEAKQIVEAFSRTFDVGPAQKKLGNALDSKEKAVVPYDKARQNEPFAPKRPCRHCGGWHLDFKCPDRPAPTKGRQFGVKAFPTDYDMEFEGTGEDNEEWMTDEQLYTIYQMVGLLDDHHDGQYNSQQPGNDVPDR
jgi:hypothetical protein